MARWSRPAAVPEAPALHLTWIGASLLLQALGSCPGGTDKISVQVPWYSQPQFAGWEVPNSFVEGAPTYAEECLRVQVRPGGPDFDGVEELLSGRADVALAEGALIAQAVDAGKDLTVIANYFQRSALSLVSIDPYGSLQELQGKRVGIWGSGYDVPIRMMMRKANVSVQFVSQSFSMDQLYSGSIDAASAMQYNELALIMEGLDPSTNFLRQRKDITVFTPSDVSIPHIHCALIVKTSRLDELAGKVVRMLRVVNRAWLFCRDNEMACAFSYPRANAHFVWQMREISKLIFPSPGGIGVMSMEMWREMDHFLVDQQVISRRVGDGIVNNTLILEAIRDPALNLSAVSAPFQPGTVSLCAPYGSDFFVVCDPAVHAHTLCPIGKYPVGDSDGTCAACSPGSFSYSSGAQVNGTGGPKACAPKCDARMLRCSSCPAGFYQDQPGQSACKFCERGRFRGDSNAQVSPDGSDAATCTACPPGQFGSEVGAQHCLECPPGFASDTEGVSLCVACDLGRFSSTSGATSCEACGTAKTTAAPGASEEGRCICMQGTYESLAADCLPCPTGMECPEGAPTPRLLPSFWASASDDETREYSVFRCLNDQHCPGGAAGTCAANRGGIGCGTCAPGTTPKDNSGDCMPCADTGHLPVVFLMLGLAALSIAMVVYARVDVAKTTSGVVSLGVCLGQSVTAAQAVAVVGDLTVRWEEPIRSFLKLMSIFTFNIDMVKYGCFVSTATPAGIFVLKLMLFPIIAAMLIIIFSVLCKCFKAQVTLNSVCNSLGLLLMMLYLTLTIVSFSPFRCIKSPNGTSSVANQPQVICARNDDFVAMAVLGCCGLMVYTVSFFSAVLYVTVSYPSMLASGHGAVVVARYRFLFQRFATERYFYAPIYLLRNFSLALVPIIFSNSLPRQVLALAVLLLSSQMLQTMVWPWRERLPNLFDAVTTGCILLGVLVVGMMIMPNENGAAVLMDDLQVFCTITLFFCLCIMALILAYLGYRRLRPLRQFMAFLTHHKLGCAVGARLVKMELESMVTGKVFLDADYLQDLQTLLDIVRVSVRTLVVLLTSETLWRPWCAGEIATAYKNGVPMVCLAYDDYVEPTDADLDPKALASGSKWSVQAFVPITLQGVTVDAVHDAYTEVRKSRKLQMPIVHMSRFGTLDQVTSTIQAVVEFCSGKSFAEQATKAFLKHASAKATSPSIMSCEVVVIANSIDSEAIATALVLVRALRSKTQLVTKEALNSKQVKDLNEAGASPNIIVVALTPGALACATFAKTLVVAQQAWSSAELLATRTARFLFPNAEALAGSVYPSLSQALGCPPGSVTEAYHTVLTTLALPFTPEGHIGVMNAEVHQIVGRMKANAMKGSRTENDLDPKPLLDMQDSHSPPVTRLDMSAGHAVSTERSGQVVASQHSEDRPMGIEIKRSQMPVSASVASALRVEAVNGTGPSGGVQAGVECCIIGGRIKAYL